jgi:hypothetical protein
VNPPVAEVEAEGLKMAEPMTLALLIILILIKR